MGTQWKSRGKSTTTPISNKKRRPVKLATPKTESILLIGSEHYYDSFWWKMMFVGAASSKSAHGLLRSASRKTLGYVDSGYTRFEKLAIESLATNYGFSIVALNSTQSLMALMNRDRPEYRIRDLVVFSHGIPGKIDLNYWSSPKIVLGLNNITIVSDKAFSRDGRFFSYACRTGTGVGGDSFDSETEAYPQESLAQKMAVWFNIEVHAHMRRTLYRDVLRPPSSSKEIVESLNKERKSKEGSVISISPEYEGLPHDGLGGFGEWKEGTKDYALWRKGGGIALPVAAATPEGLPATMKVYKPR